MIETHQETAEAPRAVVRTPTHEDLEVSVSVVIKADRRRILNALTITEYMDAWMRMPGMDEDLSCAEDPAPGTFQLDIYSSNALQSSIYGYSLLSTPDHLMYVWKKMPCDAGRESVVDIHLQDRADRCTLNLKHSGLPSINESHWHSAMWKRSLENLCRLMEA